MKDSFDQKFQTVLKTPAGYAFFVAIHDFIEHIELHPTLAKAISLRPNKELDIPKKYAYLKQIYQGLEDINSESTADFGHSRYMVIRELDRIKNKETSESNSFWKKRELFRKLVNEIYAGLSAPEAVPQSQAVRS